MRKFRPGQCKNRKCENPKTGNPQKFNLAKVKAYTVLIYIYNNIYSQLRIYTLMVIHEHLFMLLSVILNQ